MSEDTKPADIDAWTRGRIARLWRGYSERRPSAVGAMARIRRCADGRAHNDPETLEWVLDEDVRGERREWAARTALGLYAFAQRSNADTCMQDDGTPFMQAVRSMQSARPRWAAGIAREFRFLTASDLPESVVRRLRGLARMLGQTRTPCDWGGLALDLLLWTDPARRDSVRIDWGRDWAAPRRKRG